MTEHTEKVILPCPECGEDVEILPMEIFGDIDSIFVTGCNHCTMWWVIIPGGQIDDFDALMEYMGKVIVEEGEGGDKNAANNK